MFKRLALITLASLALLAPAKAANIIVKKLDNNNGYVIGIFGEIKPEDAGKFKALTARIGDGEALVGLNSPGGNVIAGLFIAHMVHEKHWATMVANDGICTSMCADIWLGGETRIVGRTAKIGVHSAGATEASRVKGKKIVKVVRGDTNMFRSAYYLSIGMTKDAAEALLRPDPTTIMWLTPVIAESLGITYKVAND